MEFIGVSKAKEINKGNFIGNAYEIGNKLYSSSTYVYDGFGEQLNHDITVVEDDIEVYRTLTNNYLYRVVK